jgi:hypothetical protein
VHAANFTTWTSAEQAGIFRILIRQPILTNGREYQPAALVPRREMQFSPHLAQHGVIDIVSHFAFKGT